ncbi:hypothetical protein SCP_0301800 [Sparassis crispa]|uniref:Uncharacterized protein n=1 Tax=Sparassis crispa TaxID=139825 RepID=A0A401GEB6_9APHY|nr:hypothetical protein SCP_0301800 [Sparassis crispa]GBE80465.1 hypothetical protein SCP_0301800 [Sparassis crispa]
MAPDPPSFTKRPNNHLHPPPMTQNVNLTPAQVIAQAWNRESQESQEQWRMADAKARQQYTSPHVWANARKAASKGKM